MKAFDPNYKLLDEIDVYKRQRVRMASPSRRTRSCVVRSYSVLVCLGRTPFSAACRTGTKSTSIR